jgi:thiazolinyl imide reductase
MGEQLRAIVCGATFGALYAQALLREETPYKLAGIVGRGHHQSESLAKKLGVKRLAQNECVKGTAELACVVVRSGLLGGNGSDIAQYMLSCGMDVIQEHPLHERELVENIRWARKYGQCYYLNTFYDQLTSVRQTLSEIRKLMVLGSLGHVEITCAYQVAFAALDLLFGLGEPYFKVTDYESGNKVSPEFARITGKINPDISFGLRIDMTMDANDPNDSTRLLLRIDATADTGTLILIDTQGPLLWVPSPRVPKHDVVEQQLINQLISLPDKSFSDAIYQDWPTAISQLICQVHQQRQSSQWLVRAQRHLEICRLWSTISSQIGLPHNPMRKNMNAHVKE